MSKKLFIASLVVALPFAVSCDNDRGRLQQEEAIGPTATTTNEVQEEQDATTSQVVDRKSSTSRQAVPANVNETEVNRGSTDVQYTTKRHITETVLKEEQIPSIQVCETRADINRMEQKDFAAIGFDQQTAQKIVQQRQQMGGRFSSVDDLSQIQGISQDKLSQLRNDLGVAAPAERQAEETQPMEAQPMEDQPMEAE